MWKFGIYADRDSFFVGGEPGRWIGVHVDLPWSEDCKDFGAPYMIYVHWWPGHCKSWSVPFISNSDHPTNNLDKWKWHKVLREPATCTVIGCDNVSAGYTSIAAKVRYRNGVYHDKGMMSSSICQKHADEFGLRMIRLVASE